MALVLDDRVRETSSTTGTGTLNLGGAVGGFQTFVAGVGDGNTTYYAIVHRTEAEWELGVGTVTDASTDTLARTTVISSSNSDSAVSFSAGTKDVFVTQPASKAVYEDAGADVTLPDDLILGSDSAVLKFGADSDTTLTHTDGTGLTLNSTNKLTFQDTGTYIYSNADGDLDLVSDGTAVDSINLESAGGITLDAGTAGSGIVYEDDGTEMLRVHNSSSDVYIESKVSDKDMYLRGNDGGSGVNALKLDMSEAGAATFNSTVTANAGVVIDNITIDGTEIDLSSGDLTLDAAGDIILDAGGADVRLKDDGTTFGSLNNSSGNLLIQSGTTTAATFSGANVTFAGEVAASTLDISSNVDIDGTTNLDAVDIDGAVQVDNTITVGENDTGYDVKFFGATSGAYMLWDESTNDLKFVGSAGIDVEGNIDIDGTTNLDAVQIDGAVQLDATLTVGADDQGYDIKFFGDTASAYMLWDTSADDLVFAGAAGIDLAGSIDVDGTANLDNTDIDGTLAVDGTTISLDATTSLNIDNSNTSNGVTIATATSGVPISIGHSTSETTINDNLTVTGNFTVSGTSTTIDSTTVAVADAMFKLAKDQGTSADALDFGFYGQYGVGGTAKYAGIFRDLSATGDPFTFFDTLEAEPGTTVNTGGTGYDLADIAAGGATFSDDIDVDGTTNLDAVDIDGAVQIDGVTTFGVDDTGVDVKFFGATASAYLLWDESADKLLTAGGAVIDIVKDKLLIGSTAVTTTAAELNVLDAVTAGTVTASLGVVVDSNKDIGTFRNITLSGELDAGSLDVSGDADIDGTLEADAITIGGTSTNTLYASPGFAVAMAIAL